GGTPQSFYVAGHSPDPSIDPLHPPDARVDLPHGGDLALFFQVTNGQGCSNFDSDFGKNFHFPVDGASGGAKATLTLASDHSAPALSGTLVAGGSLEIAYDPDRLGACRMEFNGHPGWTITGFSIANGGAPRGFHVAGFNPVPVGDPDAHPVIDLTAGRL